MRRNYHEEEVKGGRSNKKQTAEKNKQGVCFLPYKDAYIIKF